MTEDSSLVRPCPDEAMAELLATLQRDDDAGLILLDRLLITYPHDARLYFLQGSVLAGLQKYAEGREAMAKAVDIAPHYELARFQLGFLEFTSGMPNEAASTWAPFAELPEDAAFRLLSQGLNALGSDDFAECDRLLRLGMAANHEHPMVNGDMQLILDEIAGKIAKPEDGQNTVEEPASAAHLLLQQFELRDSANKTKH